MKKVGLVVKMDAEVERKADMFENWLLDRDIDVVRRKNPPDRYGKPPGDLVCIFVLGGDGTFLSAVRWVSDASIPLIGIKFGEIGFLAEISENSLYEAAEAIFLNEFRTVSRIRLAVTVFQNGEKIADEAVLNDVVINRGALARLANIETWIDGKYLTTYRADGLIISTPTGSTAYSLAAGGPVIHPDVDAVILAPICPFTLTNRPLIIPDSAEITIRLAAKTSDVMLTFDGQAGFGIDDSHEIVVRKADVPVRMIMLPGRTYFDVLKAKLSWSGGRV